MEAILQYLLGKIAITICYSFSNTPAHVSGQKIFSLSVNPTQPALKHSSTAVTFRLTTPNPMPAKSNQRQKASSDTQQNYNCTAKDQALLSWTATLASLNHGEKAVNALLSEKHLWKRWQATVTTATLLKIKTCRKENLHTDTWKSQLHFEEDSSHNLRHNPKPDSHTTLYLVLVPWLNNYYISNVSGKKHHQLKFCIYCTDTQAF